MKTPSGKCLGSGNFSINTIKRIANDFIRNRFTRQIQNDNSTITHLLHAEDDKESSYFTTHKPHVM